MPSSRWDAVIFDYGRVLSLAPSADELQQFAALVGVTEPPFFEIYSATRHDYDRGLTDFRQHWQAFCDAAGVELGPAQVERIAASTTGSTNSGSRSGRASLASRNLIQPSTAPVSMRLAASLLAHSFSTTVPTTSKLRESWGWKRTSSSRQSRRERLCEQESISSSHSQ